MSAALLGSISLLVPYSGDTKSPPSSEGFSARLDHGTASASARPASAVLAARGISSSSVSAHDAAAPQGEARPRINVGLERLAPDLRTEVEEQLRGERADRKVPLIITFSPAHKGQVKALAAAHELSIQRDLGLIDGFAVTMPLSRVARLMSEEGLVWASPDREVMQSSLPSSHVTRTTGVAPYNDYSSTDYTGKGVTVAVLDSGVCSTCDMLEAGTTPRVKYFEDFTSDSLSSEQRANGADLYGHGTHVASLIAGDGERSPSSTNYIGMAPGARVVNLRVLNGYGQGYASSVVAALDRVLALKQTYKIRVVNLSLGGPPLESYRTDPLCLAVEKLVKMASWWWSRRVIMGWIPQKSGSMVAS
ncbi:MAG: S8 family serine peptidase [Myxococcota bacterium]